ncbi:type II toxin-antitoxin system VapC family toxin [Candidatus Finniella inopinata]|uniref:type II toxin-antitoxin system VapC family toxin n=1 Tax=Candidatus Finniella inopinata TaxID=1696036 RepID=UPI001A919DDE|nr:type II toxin-antitoxin system VapC family toxin [Candidatus Finniella inopinata]
MIDCSFFMASLLPDENNTPFDFSAYSVYVPAIFFLECLNVLGSALKKQRLTSDQYEACVSTFKDIPFVIDYFSSTPQALFQISRLSADHHLTSYDASYLELALRLKAPMGTFDKDLREASQIEKLILL